MRADAATTLDRVGEIEVLAMVRRLTATMQHRGPDTLGQVLMRREARSLSAALQKFAEEGGTAIRADGRKISAARTLAWRLNGATSRSPSNCSLGTTWLVGADGSPSAR